MKTMALSLIVALSALMSGGILNARADDNELKIGAILSLTGMAAAHGTAIRDGIEFAKSTLENSGRRVSITYQDDATSAKNTISGVEQLAASGIRYVIGPTWGNLSGPAEPSFRRHKMLSFQPANSSEFVPGSNEQFFFILSPPSSARAPLVEFLAKHRGSKVGIVNVESLWGSLWQKLFQDAAKEVGLEVVVDELLQFGELEVGLRSLTTKLKQRKVDILLSTTWSQGTALTVAELERQQVKLTLLSPDLNESVNERLVKTESRFVDGFTIIPREDPVFIEAFSKTFGRKPLKYTDTAYDALMIIVEAVTRAGDDTEAVKRYLVTSLDVAGKSGRLKFGASHDVQGAGYEVRRVVARVDK